MRPLQRVNVHKSDLHQRLYIHSYKKRMISTYGECPIFLVQLHVDVQQVGVKQERILVAAVGVRRNQAQSQVHGESNVVGDNYPAFEVSAFCLARDFTGVSEEVRHAALLDQLHGQVLRLRGVRRHRFDVFVQI